ncbi:MAG: AI-2E family transporter [Nitrososphaerales archaeon]
MPDSSPSTVDQSRQAWRNLWTKIVSITPKQAGRLVMGLIAVGAITWVAVASWPALLPFVVGGAIAYTVLPLVNALDKVLPRFLSALVGVLLALAVLGGLVYIIAPPLVTQLIHLLDVVPNQAQIEAIAAGIAVDPRFVQLPPVVQKQVLDMVIASLTRVETVAAGIVPALFGGTPFLTIINTFSNILGLVVLPTWALVLLKDQPRVWPTFANVLPPGMRRDARALVRIVDRAFGTFLRGQVIVGIAVGLATYAGLYLLEQYFGLATAYKLPLAVLAGFLQLIPEVGPIVNIIGTTLLALVTRGQLAAVEVLVLYAGIQWLTGKLVADRFEAMSDVHPAVLVLVIVALTQLGALWFFLAAPLASVARDIWRYIFGRLKEPSLPAGLLPSQREAYERKLVAQAPRPLPAAYRRR